MTYGFSTRGFLLKPQSVIEQEIQSSIQANGKPNYRLTADSADGEILLIVANLLARTWEQLEMEYYAKIPSYAQGVQLDGVNEIRGIPRLEQRKTIGSITVSGTEGTIIEQGSLFSTATNGDKFYTLYSVIIPSGGSVDVAVEAVEYGPIEAPIGALTVIEQNISGVTSVTNSIDFIVGRHVETDTEYRIRAERELALYSKGTYDAILSNVFDLDGVTNAWLIENEEITSDSDGRPPKSFELIVEGGDSTEIAKTIWRTRPVGIKTTSTVATDFQETVVIQDSQGYNRIIYFSRPEEVEIYVEIDVIAPSGAPFDLDSQIKLALINYTQNYQVDKDVYATELFGTVYSVLGGLNVTSITVGTTDTAGETFVDINSVQKAKFALDRITVNVS